MKKIVFLTSIFILFIGCEKERDNQLLHSIVIGDNSNTNFIFSDIEPDTIFRGWGKEESYYFDLDSNAVNDIQIKIHADWIQGGMILASSTVNLVTLSNNVYISVDTLNNPNIFHLSDTLRLNDQWKNGDFLLLETALSSDAPYDKYTISGIWNNISESYIGIKLKENQLGWAKVDITSQSVKLYEYVVEK